MIIRLYNHINVLSIFVILTLLLGSYVSSSAEVTPVSDRTSQVQSAIVSAAGVNSANDVTDEHLAAITTLNLRNTGISELKSGDFSGLTGLTNLNLYGNQLSELPANIFEGLTALGSIRLGGNTIDPIPIVVSLEKVGTDQVRAVVQTGALSNIVVPVIVTNGILADGVSNLTIPIGTTASNPVTVSRTVDTTDAVTVDIGTIPSIPRNHYGYTLTKSETVPIEIIAAVSATTPSENNAPIFTDGDATTRTLAENTETGENIGTPITATDADGDTLTYSIVGGELNSFDIDTATGQLKTKAALDYELKTSYNITLTVSDGELTDTIAVTINITDVTDNRPPTFNEGEITVRSIVENSVASTKIGEPILATDLDENTLTYSLSGYNASAFEINTNTAQLSTKTSLDYESQRFYVVVVNATDDTYTDSITVIIQIIDVDDVPNTPITLDVSERTQQVQDAILEIVSESETDVDTVDQITDTHLTQITVLNLRGTGITQLKRGDFSGLTSLDNLNLYNNEIVDLPIGIFDGLTELTTLRLGNNPLHPFPLFVSMQKVRDRVYRVIVPSGAPFDIEVPLIVKNGSLSDGKTSITISQGNLRSETFTLVEDMMSDATPTVDIGNLPTIPAGHFGYILTKSTACNRTPQVRDMIIELVPNITDCRHVTDVNLATIAQLNLDEKGIEDLNPLDFSGMLSLTSLSLKENKITELPDEIFFGLYSLKALDLSGNWISVPDSDEVMADENADDMMMEMMMLPLPVSVEIVKLNDTDIKAVVPTGAPFDIVLPLTIPNGMLPDEVTEIVVRTGEVESPMFTVSRIPDTIGAVTVDFEVPETLPLLHAGYVLTKTNKERLDIISRIETSPVFTEGESATRTITENVDAGVNIGTVVDAYDANEDILTYTLSGDDADKFEIEPETGQLITSAPLDFEEQDTYSVIVNVTDGIFTQMIPVTISVVDVNDPPQFVEGDNTERAIGEHAPADQNIGSPVTASDADYDTLTYALEGDDAEEFALDTSNGQIKTKDLLDYEAKDNYTVVVKVSDTEDGTDSIEVTINIYDENDAPTFTEGDNTSRSIPENTDAGTNIGSPVSATDVDNDTLTYSIAEPDANSFEIDTSTGQLKTKEALDFETKDTYTLKVTVSDSDLNDTIDVEIKVTDVDEIVKEEPPTDPVMEKDDESVKDSGIESDPVPENSPPEFTDGDSTTRSVNENTPSGTNIGTPVAATDANSDDLTYTLSGTDAISFNVIANSGQLQTSATLDYETQSTYSVTITVSDGALTDSIAVTINVNDVDEAVTPLPPVIPPSPTNNAPVFTDGPTATRSVPENTPSGTNIGTAVSATDADGDDLTYTLSGTDTNAFTIIENTGQLQTNALLDYETKSTYSVTITVSDGSLTDSIAVTITITDVDEAVTPLPPVTPTLPTNNAPVFTEGTTATRSVPENTPSGTNIGTAVSATDPDGDILTYTLSGTDANAFNIIDNTGQLQTSASLDYETQSVYNVTITVSDNALTDSIAVTINVTDVDETEKATPPPVTPPPNNAPVFTEGTSTTRSVSENTPSGTNIGAAVSANDADNDTLTYSIEGTDAGSFAINTSTGQLRTQTVLDYETRTTYNITITVSDSSLTDSIAVTIQVINVNEYAPVFTEGTSTTRSVSENTPSGTNIGTPVSATDADNDNLTYTLSGTDASSFSIVGGTGQLQTSASLDYETKTTYNITITASDGSLTDSIAVTIQVINVDENPPVFTEGTETTRTIDENVPIGTSVGDPITATHVNNLTITYSLFGDNASDFSITNTGQILTAANISYVSVSQYVLTVLALSSNLKNARIQVTINVNDSRNPLTKDRTSKVKNAIVRAIPGVNDPEDVTSEQLSEITELDLSHKHMSTLNVGDFAGLTSLSVLDLSENDISSLPEGLFDDLTSLEELYLDQNELTEFPTEINNLTALKKLNLFSNMLGSLSANAFSNLTNLEHLGLTSISITSLPVGVFNGLTSLQTLQLSKNLFTTLPVGVFTGLTSLTKLDLSGGKLSSLDADIFNVLTNLTWLDLSENKLESLPSDVFKELSMLSVLYLHSNQISSLPSNLFDSVTSLTLLDLSGNSLSSIPNGLFVGLTSLRILSLDGNDTIFSFYVHIEKGESDGTFKVVVPTGATKEIDVEMRKYINNDSTDTIINTTIPKGAGESETLTVTRPSDSEDKISIAIISIDVVDTLHLGYIFEHNSNKVVVIPSGSGAPMRIHTKSEPIPKFTGLLSNYPNPFNPETWIPYQLSKTSDVTITIYNMRGVVVRKLALGHQKAGYYTNRKRAAHWNGRNSIGERVAAGVYFATFKAGNYSATRKMLIRK